ncbi:antitermination regulator [Pantoea rodasii]|uniref:Antitermination regulator n=1 Tax=Pantoea rodasii TaxID=1076549 RepID=A0A2M9W649_9GAMM|nr:ANTAR domain-containing protein [Pantoea rodasii]ORM65306.1 antitermination regulator [Pantoea rodasii]PJZ02989.1 antitermination regulator [Pantoea rodasii]
MSRKNVQMRGLKVCVIGCADRDNHHLEQQFSRMGIQGEFCAAFPTEAQLAGQQLLVFDGDNPALFHPTNKLPWPALPKIALTAMETPSRLQWITEQKIDSYMRKPVRFDGVMTAFTLALESAARINQLEAQLKRQEERLRARKYLFSAQILVMKELQLGEDDAYNLLRHAAMAQHMTIENLSCEFLNNTTSWLNLLKVLAVEKL